MAEQFALFGDSVSTPDPQRTEPVDALVMSLKSLCSYLREVDENRYAVRLTNDRVYWLHAGSDQEGRRASWNEEDQVSQLLQQGYVRRAATVNIRLDGGGQVYANRLVINAHGRRALHRWSGLAGD